MQTSTTVGFPIPDRGANNWSGYSGGDTAARHALKMIDDAIAALNGTGQGSFVVTAPANDQTITGGHKLINTGGFQGPITGDATGNLTGNVTGNVTGDVTGNVKGIVQEPVAADVVTSIPITAKQGVVGLGSSGALAVSLADPTNLTDDGKVLKLVAVTAQAHVITITGGLSGGANNTATLGGAVGDMLIVEAKGGKWIALPSINSVASHV